MGRYANGSAGRGWAVDTEATRKRGLAAIHVLKSQAGMTEDEYRAMLHGLTGKRSAADLTDAEFKRVFDGFAKLGVKSTARVNRDKVGGNRAPLIAKIDAQLKAAGRGRDYLKTLLPRLTGESSLEACDGLKLQKVVVALTLDAQRHGRAYPPRPHAPRRTAAAQAAAH